MENRHDVEQAVQARYSTGAKEVQERLCCPVDYDTQYLKELPAEIIEKDYGCGDPSAFVRPGDVVLDLGSGGGKICYIAAQIVGPEGRVIGVDRNDDMLALAEKYLPEMAEKIGAENVDFRKGSIQDLRLNLRRLETYLQEHAVHSLEDLERLEAFKASISENEPLVENDSIDIILSNCVLNLVDSGEKEQLFEEMFRVVKPGGRVAISDIVSDEDIPEHLQKDPVLWSGCISGSFREDLFLEAFVAAGFVGVRIEKRDAEPWRTVEGIDFHSYTVTASKPLEGASLEQNHAILYRGPWARVMDDSGRVFERGVRVPVCGRTFRFMTGAKTPYEGAIFGIAPRVEIPEGEAEPFDSQRTLPRHARETKGMDYDVTVDTAGCWGGATSLDSTSHGNGGCCS
jgi:ubiquinone/menaquinone biosynthesis C-methylase UbiE